MRPLNLTRTVGRRLADRLFEQGRIAVVPHCWSFSSGLAQHRDAPQGISHCRACGRIVVRGEGRWWM